MGSITRSCPLLNYLLINSTYGIANVMALKLKVQLKYETELHIARASNNMKFLREKWATFESS